MTSSGIKSPLHPLTAIAGAAFSETSGWALAEHYGNAREEHLAVRKAAGLIDLSHRGKIRVEGKDSATFLHGMLTQDVKRLAPGEGAYACLLNAQARVLADLYLYALPGGYLIDCAAGLTAKILAALGKYIIMEDVTLKEVTGEYAFLAVEGPRSPEIIRQLGLTAPPADRPNAHGESDFSGNALRICNVSLSGERGFALLAPARNAAVLWEKILGLPERPKPFGRAAANSLRLEAGIPWYGIDMDERNLFPETGLPHALSESKGCYIGQEVVARLMTYAQVNKRRVGLEFPGETVPAAGALLYENGREAGHVTSACLSPSLGKIIGMGYLHRAFAETGRRFETAAGGQAVSAALPFVNLRST